MAGSSSLLSRHLCIVLVCFLPSQTKPFKRMGICYHWGYVGNSSDTGSEGSYKTGHCQMLSLKVAFGNTSTGF